jgi:hypothetical protein
LDNPQYNGQAAYRLVWILLHLKQNEEAFKLYSKLTERQIEKQWLNLVDETIKTEKYLIRNH